MQIEQAAARLDEATLARCATEQFDVGAFSTIDEAYAVQAAGIRRRTARGERVVGVKLGFTSKAKMAQMGVDDVILGRLTNRMRIPDQGVLVLDNLIHPRVEPEIAFIIGRPLSGPVSQQEALWCVDAVAPALEVIDSRYSDFKFSLADVVADNSSAAGFVLGALHKPDIDLANLGITMSLRGRPMAFGSSAALLGHPLSCLAEASRLIAEQGGCLETGWVVLAGAATEARPLPPASNVAVHISRLGRAEFNSGETSKDG